MLCMLIFGKTKPQRPGSEEFFYGGNGVSDTNPEEFSEFLLRTMPKQCIRCESYAYWHYTKNAQLITMHCSGVDYQTGRSMGKVIPALNWHQYQFTKNVFLRNQQILPTFASQVLSSTFLESTLSSEAIMHRAINISPLKKIASNFAWKKLHHASA